MSSLRWSARHWLRSVALVAVVSAGLLSVIGSGGEAGEEVNNSGLVISKPASGAYQTDRPTVTLGGSSFGPAGTACPTLAGDGVLPGGYRITWSNNSTGATGSGSARIICVAGFYGDAGWSAKDIPLALGENSITVTASDGVGHSAQDTIVVTRVPDTTPPSVASVVPADKGACAALEGTISAEFSEAINSATVNESSFVLMDNMGAPVPGVVTASDASATFTPSVALALDASYRATITSAVTDLAGNAPTSDFTWSFTTAEAVGICGLGTYAIVPNIHYTCGSPFPIVDIDITELVFQGGGPSLAISGLPVTMSGTADNINFEASGRISGDFTETYSITGHFTTPNDWTGVLSITAYGGASIPCSKDFGIHGTRAP
jgi:hypothetical protein